MFHVKQRTIRLWARNVEAAIVDASREFLRAVPSPLKVASVSDNVELHDDFSWSSTLALAPRNLSRRPPVMRVGLPFHVKHCLTVGSTCRSHHRRRPTVSRETMPHGRIHPEASLAGEGPPVHVKHAAGGQGFRGESLSIGDTNDQRGLLIQPSLRPRPRLCGHDRAR